MFQTSSSIPKIAYPSLKPQFCSEITFLLLDATITKGLLALPAVCPIAAVNEVNAPRLRTSEVNELSLADLLSISYNVSPSCDMVYDGWGDMIAFCELAW